MNWDSEDRLHEINLGGGGNAYYVYDSAGQRVRKVIESLGGVKRKERIYLGGFEIYREYEANGQTIGLERESLHVMDDQRRIALVETQTVGNSDQLIRYQLGNHLGSASLELDEFGDLISYEEYHPYGTTAFQAGRSAAEVSLKRYRYTAKERDEESGFNYHGARYYAPWLARWVAADPAGMVDGTNLFGYVSGNPVKLVDPTGRQSNDDIPDAGVPFDFDLPAGVPDSDGNHDEATNPAKKYEVVGTRFEEGKTLYTYREFVPPGSNDISGDGSRAADPYAPTIELPLLEVGDPQDASQSGYRPIEVSAEGFLYRSTTPGEEPGLETPFMDPTDLIGPGKAVVRGVGKALTQAAGKNAAIELSKKAASRTLHFKNLEVRAVRDLSHVDDATLRAMAEKGFAPKTINGEKIILHHHRQNPAGFIVEMPASNHNIGNLRQHPFGNVAGAGLTAEERAAFNTWRTEYWQWRAQQELARRSAGGTP
jgi:RHS repeat-associated protein